MSFGGSGFGRNQVDDEDDDLYEGYNDIAANQQVVAASVAAHKANAKGGFTQSSEQVNFNVQQNMQSMMRTTAGANNAARPSTAVTSGKAAGYSSDEKGRGFDPLNQDMSGPAKPLVPKTADSVELQAREMEKNINTLIEESAQAAVDTKYVRALEKAKEAIRKERFLCRFREKNNLSQEINSDLTYAVCFNMANQYHNNNMLMDALNSYTIVVKKKEYPAGRLRVNMGNIYYQMKKYTSAIKMYRMAMDQISHDCRETRFHIMRNIGNTFVRLGQFQDAIQSYESIMEAHPEPQAGFNLIICYYATGDRDKMKKGFTQLLAVQADYLEDGDEDEDSLLGGEKKASSLNMDALKRDRRIRRKRLQKYVHTAAKLISPVIERDFSAGFDWCIEYLKSPVSNNGMSPRGISEVASQLFTSIAMEMEIGKGIVYLKRKDITKAIEVFQSFERKDRALVDQAATNLAFLHFLKNDLKSSERYADQAVEADRYNAKALVNKANNYFVKGQLENARVLYLEAIGVEADCVEAIYNLGLANKALDNLQDALKAFLKLNRIVPKDAQVIYHIANLYDLLNEHQSAAKWFRILHGAVPTDPKVLARLGTLYNKEEDETQAFHNFSESYHTYPVNMDVISWLGIWYVKSELYEDAIQFFERAAEIEPNEVKWQLMVASCYRRNSSYHKALALYKKIHAQEPENIECLRYLANLCKELNDDKYVEYQKLLRKAERASQKDMMYMQNEVPTQNDMYNKPTSPSMGRNNNITNSSHNDHADRDEQLDRQFVNSIQVDENGQDSRATLAQTLARNQNNDDDLFDDEDLDLPLEG